MKEQLNRYKKYFSDSQFWQKLQSSAREAGLKTVYTALLLFYAYRRPETPFWARSIILGVLGYFLAPIDLIPDLSPIIGYTDDLSVLVFGLITIGIHVNAEVRTKARNRLDQWFNQIDQKELEEVDQRLQKETSS